jgi:hypothetical protein
VRLDGERKIYQRDADSGYCIRFHFCPIAAARSIGKETATLRSAGSRWVRSTRRPSHRLATRSGRSRCIRGSACHRGSTTTGKADHRPRKSEK